MRANAFALFPDMTWLKSCDEGRLAQIQFSTPDFHQVAVYFTTPYFIAIENTALLTQGVAGRGSPVNGIQGLFSNSVLPGHESE